MNDCYILLIGKMRFIYYELKYIKKPHVLVLPDMWLFYYKYITKLSNIALILNQKGGINSIRLPLCICLIFYE